IQWAGAEDVNAAVEAAERAQKVWQAKDWTERRDVMVRFADLIAEHAEQIRYLETIVTGKPNAFSGFEVNDAVQNFKFFSDADLDKAVSAAAAGITRYSGQICVAPSRLYLHEDIAEAFLVKLRKTVEDFATTFGADPLSPTTMSGPLFNHQQKKTVLAYLESGKKDATLLTGGSAVGDKGCYIQPTVFVDPQPDARVLREEVFGPVAVVVRFRTEEEAVALANDNENGLAAYVWTRDAARGFRMTRALEAGSVVVNGPMELDARIPFGGWKQSGLGVENAVEGLKAWLQIKTVIMNA
ncbi:gamma-glutamyl-gamma-aminobutyraldehyde dehydrogenase, partial [Pyricularia oryzae Y34]